MLPVVWCKLSTELNQTMLHTAYTAFNGPLYSAAMAELHITILPPAMPVTPFVNQTLVAGHAKMRMRPAKIRPSSNSSIIPAVTPPVQYPTPVPKKE